MNNVGKDYTRALFSRISAPRCISLVFVIFSLLLFDGPSLVCAQSQTSIPEEIEWTWEVRPQVADPKLPNVLLLGDSITRNYFPQVTRDLGGIPSLSSPSITACTAGAIPKRNSNPAFPFFYKPFARSRVAASSSGLRSPRSNPRHRTAPRIPALTQEMQSPEASSKRKTFPLTTNTLSWPSIPTSTRMPSISTRPARK